MELPVYDRHGEVKARVLVDDVDAGYSQWRWKLDHSGYPCRSVRNGRRWRTLYLHRLIMGCTHGDGLDVDHINRIPLDCRRDNLRICTHGQNQQNFPAVGGRSAYRGVWWHKLRSKWVAQVAGKKLGLFEKELDAARAAEAYRQEHLPFAEPDPALAAHDSRSAAPSPGPGLSVTGRV